MKRFRPQNATVFAGILALLAFCVGSLGRGQTIQLSVAMPVTNQTVTITVPGLGGGGIINVTGSHGINTQLVANAKSQATWTPARYGKYAVSSGTATQTMWVTARPMTFHWWSATLAQTNVTIVMAGQDAGWQARGVTTVDWVGGGEYATGTDGHYFTQPSDWTNNWSYAYRTGGMAIDELYCEGGFPADQVVQACAMVRQVQDPNYSISLWESGFGSNFAADAASLKSNNVTILIEDYYGAWDLHTNRWAAVRSYGLQNQAFSGIWPGNAPLTNAAAVRADVALVRLAAPEANGIAIFAPDPSLLTATDQAIEDYFLKPIIYLFVTASGQLQVWNLGNDDATGVALQFLNDSGGIMQTVDLSSLTANGQWLLAIPGGAINARIINPSGTANLYTGNSQYTTGLYPLKVPGRYVWTNGNGDSLWRTASDWNPSGPPPGNIDSGNYAYFDGGVTAAGSVSAPGGETSINSVQFITAGWTIAGSATSQDFYTYGIRSSGAGTNTINIGVSARDVVPAYFVVDTGNTLIMNGLVGAVRNNGGLIKNGSGTLTLTYANSYTGGTTINAGVLEVEPGALPGNVVNNATLQLGRSTGTALLSSLRVSGAGLTIITDNNNGYINLTAASQLSPSGELMATNCHVNQLGFDQSVGGLSGNASWYNNGSPCALTLGNHGNHTTFIGSIADASASSAISVIKTGTGVQTLAGNNSYHGTTTVSNGTLLVNGSLAAGSAVRVNGTATLGGTGTINGAVTVNRGGTLAVGSANLGTLTLGGTLTLNSGSTNYLRITKTGGVPASDTISVPSATLTYGGTLTVTNITGDTKTLAAGDTFKLFSAGSYSGLFTTSNLPMLSSGLIWNATDVTFNGVIIVDTAVNVASTNDALANLAIAPAGALNPVFASGNPSYTAANAFTNNPVRVTATSADTNATLALSFNGGAFVPLTNGVASESQWLNLNPPLNAVAVTVTAQDRNYVQTYTVAVTLQPSQTAAKLTHSVSGNTLTFTWPPDHMGYRLVMQTNNLAHGISRNTNDWMTVPGSTTNNTATIPLDRTIKTEFYQLAFP